MPSDSIQQQNMCRAADLKMSETPESPSTEACSDPDDHDQAATEEVRALEWLPHCCRQPWNLTGLNK